MRTIAAFTLALLLILSLAHGYGAGNSDERILVSAAISLKNAFEEIGQIYRSRTGVTPDFNFGASGLLQRQIEAGAPVDIFASASAQQMNELQAKGLLLNESRRDFARNDLELVVPAGSASPHTSFPDLSGPAFRRLAIGNPKTVPAGLYAQQTLRNLKIWDAIQSKLILAEDVRQVLDYVSRGEVDAGIVYATDVQVARGRVKAVARAPEQSHEPILYPIAVIRDTHHRTAATRFVDEVVSRAGQQALTRHGFLGSR